MSLNQNKNPSAVLNRPILLSSLGLSFLMFGLPIYARALGASALEIGGLYSVFTAATLFLRPAAGWALDRFGRKGFLIAGLAGYALAMGLFAVASSLAGLYLARLANGIAASLTWVSTRTIVADLASEESRGQAMGAVNEMGSRGEVIGALAGLALFNGLAPGKAWQLAFAGYAVLAAISAWLALKTVPETRPASTHPALDRPRWRFPRPFLWLLGIVFTTAISQSLITPIYLIYLQDKFNTGIGALALAFLPAGLVFSFLPSYLGTLSDRFGRAPFMAVGLLGSGLLSLLLPGLPDLRGLILLYTLSAVGWAMSVPAETAMIADLTGHDQRGRGYGLYEFMGSLGATFGPLAGGWLYDHAGQPTPFYLNGFILLSSAVWVFVSLRVLPLEQQHSTASD